ncbi:MAG: family 88 glycosyl hydrolase [Thalassobius sp.]|nr:family 88 glycosyl hydrolase [Thalassovita sp.]
MKKINKLAIMIFCFFPLTLLAQEEVFEPQYIKNTMDKAALWQIEHPKHKPYDWTNGAFYTGIMAAYETTGNKKLLKAALAMGKETKWIPGERLRHADDHAIAQTYIDLYRIKGKEYMIQPFKDSVDKMMSEQPDFNHAIMNMDWWWCDALFMAPPAFVKLANVTNDTKYITYNDKLWKECYDQLYDKEEDLFARDLNYVIAGKDTDKREANGEKIFWSRGNGWVLAGLAKVIEELPKNWETRPFYIEVYKEMAARIASLQRPDGFWKASLLDPESYPDGETSGTGFYCYALAWGINNGFLDKDEYLPVVKKAWTSLSTVVNTEGRVGWVQPIGQDPRAVSEDSWEVFGTGAFLLAGSEVIKLEVDN